MIRVAWRCGYCIFEYRTSLEACTTTCVAWNMNGPHRRRTAETGHLYVKGINRFITPQPSLNVCLSVSRDHPYRHMRDCPMRCIFSSLYLHSPLTHAHIPQPPMFPEKNYEPPLSASTKCSVAPPSRPYSAAVLSSAICFPPKINLC